MTYDSPRNPFRDSTAGFVFVLRMIDVLCVAACGLLAFWLRFSGMDFPLRSSYLAVIGLGAFLSMLLLPAFGAYRLRSIQNLPVLAAGAALAVVALFASLVFIFWALQVSDEFSRLWLGIWAVMTAGVLATSRVIAVWLLGVMRTHGYKRRRVVIFGAGELGRELAVRSAEDTWSGFDLLTFFDDNERLHGRRFGGVPVLPGRSDIADYLHAHEVDELWVALPLRAEDRVKELLHDLRHSVVTIRYAPDIFGFRLISHAVSDVAGIPMLDVTASPMTGVNRFAKILLDYGVAGSVVLLTLPLMMLIAIAVKLSSPGPVLYRQIRVGWNGKQFEMLKFRSMPVDAERNLGPVWSATLDSRAGWLGRILRRSGMDELPQFINVLRGEMSVIGPRPERPVFVEQFKDEIPGYMSKHLVKAGITGWAQVNGWRGDTDLRQRIEHDLYYIDHWSIWFDVRVMFLTVGYLLYGYHRLN